jgi:hypothetical protein
MSCSQPTDCRAGGGSPEKEDEIVQSGVLGFVLEEHPAHLTIPELSLAMNRGRSDFSARDEVERAIRDLVGAGLLYIGGGLVLPTRAALYFDGLETG